MSQGPQGDQGNQGVRGNTGSQGVQGLQGNQGNMGNQGNPGQEGGEGATGDPGPRGLRGLRGAPLNRLQALAMFLLIVLIGVVMTWILFGQQAVIKSQQDRINANTAEIVQAQIDRCYAGVAFVERFNAQYAALARIERSLVSDPSVSPAGREAAAARLKAYQAFITPIPASTCPPR